MKKIITALLLVLAVPALALAAACNADGNGDITNSSGTCTSTPNVYTIYLYKTGLCNNIDPSSAVSVPDINSNCFTTFDSGATPLAISVVNNVSSPITGGTVTRPPNGTYTHGFVLVGNTIDIKATKSFATTMTDVTGDQGNICWTTAGTAGVGGYNNLGVHTKCGSSLGGDYGVTTSVIKDLSTNGTNLFHETYPEAPYDLTYAYLLNSSSLLATSPTSVVSLLGFARYNTPIVVTEESQAMVVKFRVTQGVTADFSYGILNLYTAAFKTLTAIE